MRMPLGGFPCLKNENGYIERLKIERLMNDYSKKLGEMFGGLRNNAYLCSGK